MFLDPIERVNLTLSAGAVAASLALATPAFAGSLAVGAALEALNFRALRHSARLFLGGPLGGAGLWSAGFGLRFTMLTVAIALALWAGAHPIALLLGLSMIVPAAVLGAWLHRPPIVACEPGPPPEDPSWDLWNPWLAHEREELDEEDSW